MCTEPCGTYPIGYAGKSLLNLTPGVHGSGRTQDGMTLALTCQQ